MASTDPIVPNPDEKKDPVKVPNIPKADVDFMNVSIQIDTSWQANPQITLVYITEIEFKTLVTDYSAILMQRKSAGGGRPEYTTKLKLLDLDINRDIENVKRYLVEKYDKVSAPSYYAQFGIVKVGKIYKLPYDHDFRKAALELLISALTVHGFQNNTFGLAYWTDIQTKFNNYLQNSITIDETVSGKVGDKNILKKQIKKVLNSLLRVIEGNYPDNYKNVLRNWGFQKEKY